MDHQRQEPGRFRERERERERGERGERESSKSAGTSSPTEQPSEDGSTARSAGTGSSNQRKGKTDKSKKVPLEPKQRKVIVAREIFYEVILAIITMPRVSQRGNWTRLHLLCKFVYWSTTVCK
jgi:hypothetical protein